MRSLRALRVVVACLFLGLGTAQAPASSVTDAVAWIAGARRAQTPTAPEGRDAREVPRPEVAAAALAPDVDPGPRPPAGARAVVLQRRLYLRHAALLS